MRREVSAVVERDGETFTVVRDRCGNFLTVSGTEKWGRVCEVDRKADGGVE